MQSPPVLLEASGSVDDFDTVSALVQGASGTVGML
jgi:hypothetical protein